MGQSASFTLDNITLGPIITNVKRSSGEEGPIVKVLLDSSGWIEFFAENSGNLTDCCQKLRINQTFPR